MGGAITQLGERAGLPVRYTAAEGSRRAGNDRKVIAKQGGWAPNSAAVEGYFEAGEGWEQNAVIGMLWTPHCHPSHVRPRAARHHPRVSPSVTY
ncbi:hypothetical protein [Streptomyces sp. NPDC004533]|uniref:hypothetical protein n=1 Tax=Streptomyces sp. NPDC004533 TaxID=3154278 RepID=UPI0033B7A031